MHFQILQIKTSHVSWLSCRSSFISQNIDFLVQFRITIMYIFFLYVIYIHIQNIATSNPHKTKEKEKRGRKKKPHRLQFFFTALH